MSAANNLVGKRYGKLTVIRRAENSRKGNTMWICRCECGKEITTYGYALTGGKSKSCGCDRSKKLSEYNSTEKRTHGQTKTRLYRIWRHIRLRCYHEKATGYEYYGGRGIGVCEEWRNSFTAFRDWAYENGYSDRLSIDRINNDGDYRPDNCRWATASEQNSNRRHYKRNRRGGANNENSTHG